MRTGKSQIGARMATILGLASYFIGGVASADTWVTNITPSQVLTALNGTTQYVQLVPSGTVSNPASCAGTSSYMTTALPSSALAILLAAFVSGKQVKLLVSSTSCYLTAPQFIALGIM